MTSSGPAAPPESRVVLVTGARRGIGAACARRLARPGTTVIVHHLGAAGEASQVVEACRDLGAQAYAMDCDLSRPLHIHRFCRQLLERTGGVDILINNAARPSNAPLEDLPLEEWAETLQVNLTAPLLLSQALLPHMRGQQWGRIINLTSAVVRLGGPSGSAYVASKSGLLGLTRSMARQLGPVGITVNAVSPGAILTEQEGELLGEAQARERDQVLISLQAVRWRIRAEDVTGVIEYLASPSAWCVTGQGIEVNGGWFFD